MKNIYSVIFLLFSIQSVYASGNGLVLKKNCTKEGHEILEYLANEGKCAETDRVKLQYLVGQGKEAEWSQKKDNILRVTCFSLVVGLSCINLSQGFQVQPKDLFDDKKKVLESVGLILFMGALVLWKPKYRYGFEKRIIAGKEAQEELDFLMKSFLEITSKDDNGHVAILKPSGLNSFNNRP